MNKKNDNSTKSGKTRKKIFKKKEKNEIVVNEKENTLKTGFNLIEGIIIMVITAMIGLIAGCCITYVNYEDGRKIGCSSVKKDTEEFAKVYDTLLNDYYNKTDKEALLKSAIIGMIDYLDDPYVEYLEASDAIELNERLLGEFVGVGIEITMEDGGKSTVVGVYENSPASVAGILPGDVIVKFGDVSLEGLSSKELSELIVTDKKGQEFVLTVKRGNEELVFNLVSDNIEMKSVFGYSKDIGSKNVGYVSITSFSEKSYEQFKEVYADLINENIQGLVIDVRTTAGGNVDAAKDIASLFLEEGTVIYQKDSNGKLKKIISNTKNASDIKVVLLTNKCTSLASEVLVSSLKENLRCDIVGVETAGRTGIQKMYELFDGSYIRYNSEKWLTSNGSDITEIGIAPTHYVGTSDSCEKNSNAENDIQLKAAFELFK